MNKIKAISLEFNNDERLVPVRLTLEELEAVIKTFAPLFGYTTSLIVKEGFNGDDVAIIPLNTSDTTEDDNGDTDLSDK